MRIRRTRYGGLLMSKNDNHPASQEAWDTVKKIALEELSGKDCL